VAGPVDHRQAAAQLEQDVKAGALGLKIFKDLGLRVKRPDGTRLPVDDQELDPIWATCARLKVPVLIHTAEPQAFFEPIDYTNERWIELALRDGPARRGAEALLRARAEVGPWAAQGRVPAVGALGRRRAGPRPC
jgi:hypothetical protein